MDLNLEDQNLSLKDIFQQKSKEKSLQKESEIDQVANFQISFNQNVQSSEISNNDIIPYLSHVNSSEVNQCSNNQSQPIYSQKESFTNENEEKINKQQVDNNQPPIEINENSSIINQNSEINQTSSLIFYNYSIKNISQVYDSNKKDMSAQIQNEQQGISQQQNELQCIENQKIKENENKHMLSSISERKETLTGDITQDSNINSQHYSDELQAKESQFQVIQEEEEEQYSLNQQQKQQQNEVEKQNNFYTQFDDQENVQSLNQKDLVADNGNRIQQQLNMHNQKESQDIEVDFDNQVQQQENQKRCDKNNNEQEKTEQISPNINQVQKQSQEQLYNSQQNQKIIGQQNSDYNQSLQHYNEQAQQQQQRVDQLQCMDKLVRNILLRKQQIEQYDLIGQGQNSFQSIQIQIDRNLQSIQR